MSRNISVSETSRPVLPRHAKLKFDETRQVWVILAPERVLAPDEIAVEVLQLCDGVRSVADMVDQLAAKYAAEREAIATDVIAMLQDLADKGFLTRSAREDLMSPTLTDASPVVADPSDGLAVLEARGSTAETFGIPLAVLAELTHRCPLQCPYCSNPVELDRGGSELTTEEWKKVLTELAEIGVLQIHFSGGEPTARKDLVETGPARQRCRAVFQPHHVGGAADPRKACPRWPMPGCVMCRSVFRATSPSSPTASPA